MFEYTDYHIAPWGWELPLYFFLIGTAGMVYVFASASAVFGGSAKALEPFRRTGSATAIVLLLISAALLIVDLGQPARFLYPILYFHWTSPVSWGSVFLLLFGVCVAGFFYASLTKNDGLAKLTGVIGSLLALSMPLYTGLDLMVNQARELWANPTIPVLFVVLSVTSGTGLVAVLLTISGGMSTDVTRLLRNVLFFSVAVTLALFLAFWVVFMYGTGEEQQAFVLVNELYGTRFWLITLLLGILIPLVILAVPALSANAMLVTLAGVLGAIGAYTFREVIVYAGQLPMMTY